MKRRKRQVDTLIEQHFWDGFWRGIRGGKDDGWVLTYTYSPDWMDRVADIAQHAGWREAEAVISERARWKASRICLPPDDPPVIPGSIYAECYGEARIAVRS